MNLTTAATTSARTIACSQTLSDGSIPLHSKTKYLQPSSRSRAAAAGGDTAHVGGLAEIDEFFAQSDDGLPEREWRQALLWLLGILRHRLAELLRCPSAE